MEGDVSIHHVVSVWCLKLDHCVMPRLHSRKGDLSVFVRDTLIGNSAILIGNAEPCALKRHSGVSVSLCHDNGRLSVVRHMESRYPSGHRTVLHGEREFLARSLVSLGCFRFRDPVASVFQGTDSRISILVCLHFCERLAVPVYLEGNAADRLHGVPVIFVDSHIRLGRGVPAARRLAGLCGFRLLYRRIRRIFLVAQFIWVILFRDSLFGLSVALAVSVLVLSAVLNVGSDHVRRTGSVQISQAIVNSMAGKEFPGCVQHVGLVPDNGVPADLQLDPGCVAFQAYGLAHGRILMSVISVELHGYCLWHAEIPCVLETICYGHGKLRFTRIPYGHVIQHLVALKEPVFSAAALFRCFGHALFGELVIRFRGFRRLYRRVGFVLFVRDARIFVRPALCAVRLLSLDFVGFYGIQIAVPVICRAEREFFGCRCCYGGGERHHCFLTRLDADPCSRCPDALACPGDILTVDLGDLQSFEIPLDIFRKCVSHIHL